MSNPLSDRTKDESTIHWVEVLDTLLDALGVTRHDLQMDLTRLELSPRQWLDEKIRGLGYIMPESGGRAPQNTFKLHRDDRDPNGPKTAA